MAHFDTEKRILDFPRPLDAATLDEIIALLCARYPALASNEIGSSILGARLHRLTLGTGENGVIMVGGLDGTDQLTPALLLRFANEYSDLLARSGRIFGYNLRYLAELRRIEIIPMLNPDGNGYAINGVAEDHLLRSRLLGMNRGTDDFTTWQANARGVDLRMNFSASIESFAAHRQQALAGEYPGGGPFGWCGEAPESEPESAALSRFLRTYVHAGLLIVLSVGKSNGVYCPTSSDRRSTSVARSAARLCGFPLLPDTFSSSLCCWAQTELDLPAIEIVCSAEHDLFSLYAALRELFFVVPTMLSR